MREISCEISLSNEVSCLNMVILNVCVAEITACRRNRGSISTPVGYELSTTGSYGLCEWTSFMRKCGNLETQPISRRLFIHVEQKISTIPPSVYIHESNFVFQKFSQWTSYIPKYGNGENPSVSQKLVLADENKLNLEIV